jgi:hypothetical protein
VLTLPRYPDVSILWIRGPRIVQPLKEYYYEFWFSGTADSLGVELWAIAPTFSGDPDVLQWTASGPVNSEGDPVVRWVVGPVLYVTEGNFVWVFEVWNKFHSDTKRYYVAVKKFDKEYEQPEMPRLDFP